MSSGHISFGAPGGTKKLKKRRRCFAIASRVTKANTTSAMAKVTTMWLVKVNALGIMPSRLPNRMNMNRVKIHGKYRRPSFPTVSFNSPATNS